MIEIRVPLHEDNKPVSPNVKQHHMKAYLRNKNLKMAIKYAFLSDRFDLQAREMILECDEPDEKEKVAMVKRKLLVGICYIHPRELDYDNLVASQKATIDVVADIILPNRPAGRADSDKRIHWEISQTKGKPKEYALKITISLSEQDGFNG